MAMAQIVMDLHEAQRCEAVEPGVGDGFRRLASADFLHALDKAFALFVDLGRPGLTGNDCNVTLHFAGDDFQLTILL